MAIYMSVLNRDIYAAQGNADWLRLRYTLFSIFIWQ